MITNLNRGLGFVPLTVAGAKIGTDTLLAAASVLPSLFTNQAWIDIEGNVSQLSQATEQIGLKAGELSAQTDRLIDKLRQDIERNTAVLNRQAAGRNTESSRASTSKNANALLIGGLSVAALAGFYFINKPFKP